MQTADRDGVRVLATPFGLRRLARPEVVQESAPTVAVAIFAVSDPPTDARRPTRARSPKLSMVLAKNEEETKNEQSLIHVYQYPHGYQQDCEAAGM